MVLTSAAGVIALLQERETEMKVFALKRLNLLVDEFWPEISEAIEQLEVLYEDTTFRQRDLAALVASKVYYHLGAYDEAMRYALAAGTLFDINQRSEYIDTIVAKCLDEYVRQRVEAWGSTADVRIDARLESVVHRMFKRCLDHRQYQQAIGMALETRHVEVLEEAIKVAAASSDDPNAVPQALTYCYRVAMSLIDCRKFRDEVLRVLVRLYSSLPEPDYLSMAACLIHLDDADSVARALEQLLHRGSSQDPHAERALLICYQLAFDLYDTASQQFVHRVISALRAGPSPAPVSTIPASVEPPASAPPPSGFSGLAAAGPGSPFKTPRVTDTRSVALPPLTGGGSGSVEEPLRRLVSILQGDVTVSLHLQFLIRNNHADLIILKQTKEQVRQLVCHTSTILTNAFMHCGTTMDVFLRDNLEWLARATNWAKFTATASLGIIHRGHERDALTMLAQYLPRDAGAAPGGSGAGGAGSGGAAGAGGAGGHTSGSPYSDGGGLYALGLIYANHGRDVVDYLLNQLKNATSEIVRHGACLGLGLAAMGSARRDVYEQLRFELYQDSAISGEAAAIGIGLTMMGTGSDEAIRDLLQYAKDTQHEKIQRGLALGLAFSTIGRMEESDTLIEQLLSDKEAVLRWAGCLVVGAAYAGTGSNSALRKLLHSAVTDVSDDVRRTAVTAIGFVLCRQPEQVPAVVSLLLESYNPHVRYGAAMALGVACAASGSRDALQLLEPLLQDSAGFVRQGVLIASALILIQHNDVTCPRVASNFRSIYARLVSDKHEDPLVKFGAILAQGIIDAGGRNLTIALCSRTGQHLWLPGIVGMLGFMQMWFWFPLANFLSLAFTPSCLIGLNGQLRMPRTNFLSSARPSTFAYVPPVEDRRAKRVERIEAAVLSVAEKQRRKQEAVAKATEKATTAESKPAGSEAMEIDSTKKPEAPAAASTTTATTVTTASSESAATTTTATAAATAETSTVTGTTSAPAAGTATTATATGEKEKSSASTAEPSSQLLANPARVLLQQLRVMSLPPDSGYEAVRDLRSGGSGIIMLARRLPPGDSADSAPPEEDLLDVDLVGGAAGGATGGSSSTSAAPSSTAGTSRGAGHADDDNEPEPEPPAPFEWTDD